MKWLKRILLSAIVLVVACAAALVFLVGPWPLYSHTNYVASHYFKRAVSAIEEGAKQAQLDGPAGPLEAGWAERDITPPVGHPMAGYGGRKNDKKSEGVREPLHVRALALSDGADTVVLIGSDLLQTLPNLLEMVEARTLASVNISNRNIMYTSSHTHCGPGGLAPGIVAKEAFGEYAPGYLETLATAFADAIIEAVKSMAPARFAHGGVDVPEYIRNRCRKDGPVDSILHYAVAEKNDGSGRYFVARYSAHGTAYGEEMMAFNNDFAGAFQRSVEARTGVPLLYMGGAVGSMRPYPPGPPMPPPWNAQLARAFENDVESEQVRNGTKTLSQLLSDQEARVEAMGGALADRFLAAIPHARFEEQLGVASLATAYTPPPAQARLFSPRWRLSPYAFSLLGVPATGRLQAARIGRMLLVGLPYDVSGELSKDWQAEAAAEGSELWVTSFSGAYLGYLSPDQYYNDIGEGRSYNENYEVGQMGWFGPDQGAYVTDLVRQVYKHMRIGTGGV